MTRLATGVNQDDFEKVNKRKQRNGVYLVFIRVDSSCQTTVYAPWVNAMSAAYIHTGHLPS